MYWRINRFTKSRSMGRSHSSAGWKVNLLPTNWQKALLIHPHLYLSYVPYWHLWSTCRNIHSTCIWVDFHEGRWWGRLWCNTYRQERVTVRACVSTFVCVKQLDSYNNTSELFPVVFVATEPDILKHDLFLTPTRCFLCLNITRP